MPYFTFSSIFHERLNGQFSLFPLKISAVGRSKNLGGGLASSNPWSFEGESFTYIFAKTLYVEIGFYADIS